MKNTLECVERSYEHYYGKKGIRRNDVLRNPEVLSQSLAYRRALTLAIGSIPMTMEDARLLDVGCGFGANLLALLDFGFRVSNMYGIEIIESRIAEARDRLPKAHLFCGDASATTFSDGFFDITSALGVFLQIMDDAVRQRIASEMIRVTKTAGYIVIGDWRYSRPGDTEYNAVSMKKLTRLFEIGKQTAVHKRFHGALVPPVGRLLSKHCSPLYFLVHYLFPFLVGQTVTVLVKI